MEKQYKGVYAVVCTPFDEQGEVDEQALRRHIRWLVDDCQVQGIIPCGSTGESATLSHDEHERVIAFTIEKANKRVTF